jgi:cell division protein FtsB
MPPRSADVARELLRRIEGLEAENALLRARVEAVEQRVEPLTDRLSRGRAERLWPILSRLAPARARAV